MSHKRTPTKAGRIRKRGKNGMIQGAFITLTAMLIIFFSVFVLNQGRSTDAIQKKTALAMPSAIRTEKMDCVDTDRRAWATFDILYQYKGRLDVATGEHLALVITTNGGEQKIKNINYKETKINMRWIETITPQYVVMFVAVVDNAGKQVAAGPEYSFVVPEWHQRNLYYCQ